MCNLPASLCCNVEPLASSARGCRSVAPAMQYPNQSPPLERPTWLDLQHFLHLSCRTLDELVYMKYLLPSRYLTSHHFAKKN